MSRGRRGRSAWPSGLLPLVAVTAGVGGTYLVVDLAVGRVAGPAVAAVAATAVAAATAVPVYVRARRPSAGSRPAGDRVLSQLAALPRLPTGGMPDLDGVVEAVGRGLGAGVCTLTVRRPGLRDRVHTWSPPGAEEAGEKARPRLEVPVRHGGEDVGTIAVDRVTVAGAPAEQRRLLEAVASSLGVVLQAARAGIELERQLRTALAHATEIAAARRRTVAEADSERRRIERDLHDGAQHHLVSLSLGLGLVEHALTTQRLDQARAGLDQIAAQLDTVEDILARTTTGVTSPVLAGEGLLAALRSELGSDDQPVDLEAPAGTRFPSEIEEAVYFCCLEAVNNARKHAPGAHVQVRITVAEDRLQFAVRDDGRGVLPSAGAASPGRGMRNVAARIAAVGGHVDVRSAPGAGTTVEGTVPLPGTAPDRPAAAGALPSAGLLDRLRTALRVARDLYHGTPQTERLHALARCLDEPLCIAVVGPPGAATSALAEALDAASSSSARCPPAGRPEAAGGPATIPADAYVLVLDGNGGDLPPYLPRTARPAQTVGVLVGEGPASGASRLCQAVVAVRCGAGAPAALPAGEVARVREVVETRLIPRVEALKARTALSVLEAVLREAPARADTRTLRYQLDQIRSGAHELAELDLVDALVSGGLAVPDEQRRAAERLLGMQGVDAGARLGCPHDAGPAEVARAAAEQLAHWQRAAMHPAATAADRNLAAFLVRTCEWLLSAPPGRR